MATATIPTLTNLKPKTTRGGTDYQFYTTPSGPAIKVSIYYSAGGINYFNGKRDAKGIWLSITPVERDMTITGMQVESFLITASVRKSGIRFFLKELPRKSDKALAMQAAKWDEFAPAIATAFAESTEAAAAIVTANRTVEA